MRWQFFIEGSEIEPLNQRDITLKQTLENDIIHAYRTTLDGSIELMDEGYTLMKNLERTRPFDKFNCQMFDSGKLAFNGEFTINDCEFDDYKSTCNIKVTPRDKYTEIQENEDIEVNVLLGTTNTDIRIDRQSYWSFGVFAWLQDETETFTVPAITGHHDNYRILDRIKDHSFFNPNTGHYIGCYVLLTVTEFIMVPATDTLTGWDLALENETYKIYNRLPVDFNMSALNGDYVWKANSLNYAQFESQLSESKYESTIFNTLTSLELGDAQPIAKSTYSDLIFYLWVNKDKKMKGSFTYPQNYKSIPLKDAMNYVLSTANPTFTGTIKSRFLFYDEPESGKTYPDAYQSDFLYLHEKYLIEMSNFKGPNKSEPATKAIITWKNIIEYLCNKHNLRWTIDADGNLRIEHIIYFETDQIGLDLSRDTGMSLTYSYLQNDKPNREYLSESLSYNDDFRQIEVLYGTVPAVNGVKESTKSKALSNFYTDVAGLNTHLDELPSEGFIYMDTLNGAILGLDFGFKSGLNIQNVKLSNANCLNTYYRHNAYQQAFYIADKPVEASSLKRMKKQSIWFEAGQVPDAEKLIITPLGAGFYNSLSYHATEECVIDAEIIF